MKYSCGAVRGRLGLSMGVAWEFRMLKYRFEAVKTRQISLSGRSVPVSGRSQVRVARSFLVSSPDALSFDVFVISDRNKCNPMH